MSFDRLNYRIGDFFGFVPMRLEPILELGYLTRTLDLNVEFDVLRESRFREIAGPHQCLRTNDFELGMGDVRLRVKLALFVHAAFDLTATQPFENG